MKETGAAMLIGCTFLSSKSVRDLPGLTEETARGRHSGFLLRVVIDGVSGYVAVPWTQRIIEFLISVPTLPLWMGPTAVLPLARPCR